MAAKNGKTKTAANNSKVKVLYQNLNGVWYAFASVGDNVFFGKVPVKASAPKERAKLEPTEGAQKRTASKAA